MGEGGGEGRVGWGMEERGVGYIKRGEVGRNGE